MYVNKNIAISENGFLFNPSTGDSFSTNQLGQEIIRLLQAAPDLETVITTIHEKYAVDKSTVERDLADFLYMLKSYQILNDEG